jgi:CBS domain-containing protein
MSVGRICVREVDIVTEEESAQAAASRMHSRKVGTLVVVDDDRRPVGILTDRDLAVRVLAQGLDGTQVPVREVMTHCPETVYPKTSIEEALRRMRVGAFRRVPVVDDDGRLVGLLSLDDILDLLAEEFAEIGRLIHEEEPGSLGRTE